MEKCMGMEFRDELFHITAASPPKKPPSPVVGTGVLDRPQAFSYEEKGDRVAVDEVKNKLYRQDRSMVQSSSPG